MVGKSPAEFIILVHGFVIGKEVSEGGHELVWEREIWMRIYRII